MVFSSSKAIAWFRVAVHAANGKFDSFRDYGNPLAMSAPTETVKAV